MALQDKIFDLYSALEEYGKQSPDADVAYLTQIVDELVQRESMLFVEVTELRAVHKTVNDFRALMLNGMPKPKSRQ